MFEINQHLKLVPLTNKAKNRLSQVRMSIIPQTLHRSDNIVRWVVMKVQDSVIFSDKPGPWYLVGPCSIHPTDLEKHSRWVNHSQDPDFKIQPIAQ
jgi:hypothetical protein